MLGVKIVKIIQAKWEKRNLGINCLQIHVKNTDSAEQLSSVLKKYSEQYMVVKLPILRMDLYDLLLREQYCFIETMFHLENNITEYCIDMRKEHSANQMSYTLNSCDSEKRIRSEIENGMFNTDRISIDGYFNAKQTAKRYMGMIYDETLKGAELMEFFFQNEAFGFSCLRQITKECYYQSLVGLYPKYHNKGLGFAIAYLPIMELRRRGALKLTTGVSSNNFASLYTHLHNAFLPTNIEYVFVKHN